MSPEKTKHILTTFPLLYRELRGFDFVCGDGWFELIQQVSLAIEGMADKHKILKNKEEWPSFRAVKEKLGSLRMQGLTCDNTAFMEAAQSLIEEAINTSVKICEACSAPANPNEFCTNSGWIKTLCASCAAKNLRILSFERFENEIAAHNREKRKKA